MAIRLMKQRPPTKKMGRKQRRGSKSNPVTKVQWANWLDYPGSGGPGAADPHINSIAPSSIAATASATTITVTGSAFLEGSVIEFDNVAVPTTWVSLTSVTTSFDPTVAKAINVTVRSPNGEESNIVVLTVTATAGDPTSTWLKADIITWLKDRGVVVDEVAANQFTKAELLDIVAAYLNGDTIDPI